MVFGYNAFILKILMSIFLILKQHKNGLKMQNYVLIKMKIVVQNTVPIIDRQIHQSFVILRFCDQLTGHNKKMVFSTNT